MISEAQYGVQKGVLYPSSGSARIGASGKAQHPSHPSNRLKASLISASSNVKPAKAEGGKFGHIQLMSTRAGFIEVNSLRILLSAAVQLPSILSLESFEEKKYI